MKKLTEYKELDAATFDNSRLPLENCVYKNSKDEDWYNKDSPSTLIGIEYSDISDVLLFRFDSIRRYSICAQVVHRYPRSVPKGVTPLPEDKPFLAYIEERFTNRVVDILDQNAIYTNLGFGWKIAEIRDFPFRFVAIDVSTPWAAENFPEIVDAMEYTEVYGNKAGQGIIAHKLGNKTYDLEWNEIEPYHIPEVSKKVENEPLDTEGILRQYDIPNDYWERLVRSAIKDAKRRGKWEASQWKYKTVEEALYKRLDNLDPHSYAIGFMQARELKEVEK